MNFQVKSTLYLIRFVENIDFSKIEVLLLDEKQNLIDKTVCASNGFFLIPLYNKKKFSLKVESILDL